MRITIAHLHSASTSLVTPRQISASVAAAHLADMIPEDWLILCASDLPLKPRLRLPVVGNLQCSSTITNLWQVRHGVSDSYCSVDSSISSVEDRNVRLVQWFPTWGLGPL